MNRQQSKTISRPSQNKLLEAAGKQTVGYNIEQDLPGLTLSDHIGDISGTAWTGGALAPTIGKPILTALLISAPTVPSDGYLGQISLQVTSTLASGSILAIKSASMADFSAENDQLNVSSATVIFTSGTPAIQGDFDLDGDVDFIDFLTFSKNFGKSGPAPTSGAVATTTIVVHDTVTVTQTDTVFAGGDRSPEFFRAEVLLGFWSLNVQLSAQTITDDYLMGDIRIGYSAALEAHLILWEGQQLNVLYVFNIQDNQAAGSAFSFLPTESPDQSQGFEILPTSGRSNGFPPPPASKRTVAFGAHNTDTLPASAEVIQAYYRLKNTAIVND